VERDAGVRSAVRHGALLCPIPLAGAPRAAVPGATTMPRSGTKQMGIFSCKPEATVLKVKPHEAKRPKVYLP
jgi:hypothetical protein